MFDLALFFRFHFTNFLPREDTVLFKGTTFPKEIKDLKAMFDDENNSWDVLRDFTLLDVIKIGTKDLMSYTRKQFLK